jgi:ACS family hexuronate transporter-like MFS transporter
MTSRVAPGQSIIHRALDGGAYGGNVNSPATASNQSNSSYQILLVALLSISFGILFFDRNSLAFLMPFVQPELKLNNTQVGMLASALSFTWACAALGIGYISDKTGSRKGLLIIATVIFSTCSFLSGMAHTFVAMLGARMLMGVAEGGFMPICQAMIAAEVKPQYRGLAMGVTQNFGSNLLGSFVAPVLLVGFAESFGWRNAFFLAGAPGLVAALLMWILIRKPAAVALAASRAEAKPEGSLSAALAEPNVVICAILSILMVSYLVVCWTFMPLYLTQVRHFDPTTMGWLMGTLGISATIGAFLISGLSDFIGRRPLMIAMPLIGVVLPLGAMFYDGSAWVLAAMFFVGWGLNGIFPLFMATVPSESVDRAHIATALGLCMGLGEIIGGAASPFIAGYVADRVGLQAPLWIMIGLTIVAGLLAFRLRETAPRVLLRRAATPAPAG